MKENVIREATILVVDDQEDAVALLQQMLQKAGYTHVYGTTDSRKVIAMYEEIAPDLLILDLHMPPPNGFEIMGQLAWSRRDDESYFPILVLTADVTSITRLKALSTGAKDFLTKPVDHVDLLLCVHNLIETRLAYKALDSATRAPVQVPEVLPVSDPGDETLAVLCKVMEHNDPDLGARAQRVSYIASWIACELEHPKEFVEQIERASRIFDLGMLGVPRSVRAKTGLLTRAEQELWRRHTTAPEDILGQPGGILALAKQIACSHHERWDGEGYPNCLRGEEIPLPARVVAVAECYDNLTQAGSSPEQAVDEINRQADFAFDPAVTAALVRVIRQGSSAA